MWHKKAHIELLGPVREKKGGPKNNWRGCDLELHIQDCLEWCNILDASCFTEEQTG